MANQSLFAHARGMGTLDIHDQGARLLLTWVFYDDELPVQFALPDNSGRQVSMVNPRGQKAVLATLGESAFQLHTGNQYLHVSRISQLLLLPDKTCLMIIEYPMSGNGTVELRAPVLRLLPPNYLINVRFMSSVGRTNSVLMDVHSPPLVVSLKADGYEDISSRSANPFWTGFWTEFGTAWVHTDWILLGLLLILTNSLRRTSLLLGALILLRVILNHLIFTFGFVHPRLPAIVLCLPILLVAWMSVDSQPRQLPLLAATLTAGLLLTIYDLQFLAPIHPADSLSLLFGYDIGFLAGFALAVAILTVIHAELRKSLQSHQEWRRMICWAAAGVSAWLSFYSLIS